MSDRWIIYITLRWAPRLTKEQTVMLYGVLGMIAFCALIGIALSM